MYGLLTSYSTIPSQKKALEASWKEINNIRNNNSFIHSDTAAIYNSPLVVDASKDEDYQSCLHTLQFFLDILHLPVTWDWLTDSLNMSFKEIKQLRQSGDLVQALELANAALSEDPQNVWNIRAKAWVH